MNLITKQYLIQWTCLTASVILLRGLVSTRPAIAEPPALNKAPSTQAPDTQGSDTQTLDPQALANFRATYESMMSTFDFLLAERGDTYGQDRVAAGRESMKAVTDKALARVFSQTGIPDISGLSVALSHLMAKHA